MTDNKSLYETETSRLTGLAYRTLGSISDAEEIVQEVFERWLQLDQTSIKNPAAYLTTMTVRASIDRLRSVQSTREVYVGPWLPEPILTEPESESELHVELDESLTLGYLRLLETLTPIERAVYLLHSVFDYSYREISDMVGKEVDNCRQIASRAGKKLKASGESKWRRPDPLTEGRVVTQLSQALLTGDVATVMTLLSDDVVHISDGGADHRAARHPIVGRDRVARLLVNLASRLPDPTEARLEVRPLRVNLQPAVLVIVDGHPQTLVVTEVEGDKVRRLHAIVNPDKLRSVFVQ